MVRIALLVFGSIGVAASVASAGVTYSRERLKGPTKPVMRVAAPLAKVGWVRGQPIPRVGRLEWLRFKGTLCKPKALTAAELGELDAQKFAQAPVLELARIAADYRGLIRVTRAPLRIRSEPNNQPIADKIQSVVTKGAAGVVAAFEAHYRYAYQEAVRALKLVTQAHALADEAYAEETGDAQRIPDSLRNGYAGVRRFLDALHALRTFQLAATRSLRITDKQIDMVNRRFAESFNTGYTTIPEYMAVDKGRMNDVGQLLDVARQGIARARHAAQRIRNGVETLYNEVLRGRVGNLNQRSANSQKVRYESGYQAGFECGGRAVGGIVGGAKLIPYDRELLEQD